MIAILESNCRPMEEGADGPGHESPDRPLDHSLRSVSAESK